MTLYLLQATETCEGDNLDLVVRLDDGGTYNREAVVKNWDEYYHWGPVEMRIFAINETTVGALPWHKPDGCRLVETIDEGSMAELVKDEDDDTPF